MKYQIIVDSASDIRSEEFNSEKVKVSVVPLSIKIGEDVVIDDDNIDVNDLLQKMRSHNGKQTTSCPTPALFEESFNEADYTFCVTITAKLSGTCNAARIAARDLMEHTNKKVCVIDSEGVSGLERLIVLDLIKMIEEGKSYEEICNAINVKDYHLLFVLSKFDNLVKNGRMSKFTGMVASFLSIRPLFIAHEGEIKLLKKVRTLNKALNALVDEMAVAMPKIATEGASVIISHCKGDELVEDLKNNIINKYPLAKVEIVPMQGLCSFYAEEQGIIVSFR